MPKETFFNLPEDKRQRILDVAIDEFAAHDYRNASISRLVARAGIAKGSFYQYFEDKKDLYRYLFHLMIQEKTAILRAMPPPDPGMGVFAYIRWLSRQQIGFQVSRPKLFQVGYRALYGDSPLSDELLQSARAQSLSYFRQLVEMGLARGDLDPEIDPDVAAYLFAGIIVELGKYLVERAGLDIQQVTERGMVTDDEMARVEPILDQALYILEYGMSSKAR